MLGFYNHKNYMGMFNDFLDIVENDTSSILYHTRVFDNFVIDGIANFYNSSQFDVIPSFLFCNDVEFIFFYTGYNGFFFILYRDLYLNFFNNLNSVLTFADNKIFSESILNFFFNTILVLLNYDFTEYYLNYYILFFQKNELFNVITTSVNLFSDLMFYIDFSIIILEILIILFLFLLLFNKVSNFFITTKFYDNILNFFKYNNLSFLEISVTGTLFLSFYIFDIFLSFSEDDFSDTFFYLILIFILLMFFFLSIAMDIQYFYSMSNTSNGDVTLRLLFFDILNNFLGILRIFLCWTRYIFYDIQVETIDFSFHYIDYNNEVFLNFLLKDTGEDVVNIKNIEVTFITMLKSLFFYILFFFFDITMIIIQIILSVFKLLIAFYLLWLIVDLFILKVLCLKESNKLKRRY